MHNYRRLFCRYLIIDFIYSVYCIFQKLSKTVGRYYQDEQLNAKLCESLVCYSVFRAYCRLYFLLDLALNSLCVLPLLDYINIHILSGIRRYSLNRSCFFVLRPNFFNKVMNATNFCELCFSYFKKV